MAHPGIAAAATVRTWATACSWPAMPISSQNRTSDRGSTTSISKLPVPAPGCSPVSPLAELGPDAEPDEERGTRPGRAARWLAVYRMRATPQWLTHALAANPNRRLRKRASWGRRSVNTGGGQPLAGTDAAPRGELGQPVELGVGQLGGAEDRQVRRDGDQLADRDLAEPAPPVGREQRVGRA